MGEQKLKGLIITAKHILETEIEPKVKAELEKAIAIAKEKLQEASIAAKQAAAKVEEKIDEIAALINDKTGGAAEALIKKAEAQLKELVAKAADKVDDVKAKVQKLMEEIEAKINELLGKESTYMDISSDAFIEKIMEELEGPISKLPSLFQGIVKQAIKTALKYGIAKGKDELIHLLNKVGDKFGSDVKDITDMAIMMLEMMDKRELHERNAVIDKIVEELKKVKHAAEELLHEALEKIEAAKQDALIDWEILKAKIQEAAEKGEAMSKEMIAEAKAKILKKYQEIKPIIDNLKAQAKAKVEEIVQKIKDSVPIAAIKQFAERVKATINSFIDHIPDYEEMIKEKIEEIKSIILQQAEKVRDLLIKVENEAEQKLKGLILVAKKILEEEVKPKVKAELELLIDLAEQRFAKASSAAGEVTAKLEEKISEIAALINDKTGGAAKPLIEKAEAELKDLIAKGEVKIDELSHKVHQLLEQLKAKVQEQLGGNQYGAKTDMIVDKIMEMLEGPLSKLPDSFRPMITSAIESALRFGLTMGKTAAGKLLDLVGDKFGPSVKAIVDMAKEALGLTKRDTITEEMFMTHEMRERNAVIDKIIEELKKAEAVAKDLVKQAAEKLQKAKAKALKEWEVLKAKIEAAAAKGESISKELIAEAKAKIIEEYKKMKPIVEDIKAKAKAAVEKIVQQIEDSDAVAAIKAFAAKVKAAINNFIDHIPDYEDLIKEKIEEIKSVIMEQAKHIKEMLVKAEQEAEPELKKRLVQLINLAEVSVAAASENAQKVA